MAILLLTLLSNPVTGNPGDSINLLDGNRWMMVNDTVMGGRSSSLVENRDPSGIVFQGTVSLENNGGFASARMSYTGRHLSEFDGISIRVRGDGKIYQLRLRTDERFDGVAYRAEFNTAPSGWTTVEIPFSRFVPSFRGRVVKDALPLDPGRVRQIGLLIAGAQAGPFRLEVESISAYRKTS